MFWTQLAQKQFSKNFRASLALQGSVENGPDPKTATFCRVISDSRLTFEMSDLVDMLD